MIYSICFKYLKNNELSQDAAMDVFEILLDKLKTHEVKNFKSWLYSLVRNHCLMQLREKSAEQKFTEDFKNTYISFVEIDENSHQYIKDKEKALEALEIFMQKLNHEQKICVELFYIEEKSYAQISEITGFDFKKVKSNIQNGKRNLKIMMEEHYGKSE
ncbi:MAG: sigma-70 family RNA polymerase sigma factor [Bacteroidales bacterium]|nr:sigma-70 family RNA polymerase sigma factor [Bacteroidales bacterium]